MPVLLCLALATVAALTLGTEGVRYLTAAARVESYAITESVEQAEQAAKPHADVPSRGLTAAPPTVVLKVAVGRSSVFRLPPPSPGLPPAMRIAVARAVEYGPSYSSAEVEAAVSILRREVAHGTTQEEESRSLVATVLHPGSVVPDPDADPVAALVWLEAQSRLAMLESLDGWRDVGAVGPPPTVNLASLRDAALAWRDTAIGDAAAAYALGVASSQYADGYDPDLALELLYSMVSSSDPTIRSAALEAALMLGDDLDPQPDTWHALLSIAAADPGELGFRFLVSEHARYLEAASLTRSAEALDWIDVALTERCGEREELCHEHWAAALSARAQLLALGEGRPANWREAVATAVWTCWHAGAPFPPSAPLSVEATWHDGAWRFSPWSSGVEAGPCIEAQLGPPWPTPGQHLQLSVVPAPERAVLLERR